MKNVMKLEDSPSSTMTPTNSSANLPLNKQRQSQQKLVRRWSSSSSTKQRRNQYLALQRRQNINGIKDFSSIHPTSSSLTMPLVTNAMNTFFQATKIMEDEIMLPSKLKDMPVEESILDGATQPETWHELYTFVKDIRNQLTCNRPFADDDNNNDEEESLNHLQQQLIDDDGIVLIAGDNPQQQKKHESSASSTVSSDELEQSINTSSLSACTSFDSIKDELKFHYFGLIGSLDNLTFMANRITDKYREDPTFRN